MSPSINTQEIPEVVSLIRFSTIEQTAKGKAGEEGQRGVNRTSAVFHNVKIVKEYVIIDVPGSDVKYDPQFQQIAKDLENPRIAGLLTPEQSRLVRPQNTDDFSAVLGPFERNGKVIYTPTARLDPNTSEGKMVLWFGGMMSGEELKIIRDRFMRGKATKRIQRKHVGGDQALPSTVRYVRQHDPATGKEIEAHWERDTLEIARMTKAFDLLISRNLPLEVIAEMLGYGSGSALKRLMQNPIHIGIRRYEWEAAGDKKEVKARPETWAKHAHDPNWQPKRRRRLKKRAVPLDVPTRREVELWNAGDKINGQPPIVEPYISLEIFDRAQEIFAERLGRHRKTKIKNENRPRFLAAGIAMCSCGQPLYPKYGSRGSHLDAYICATRHPKGTGCGMHSIKRTDGDAAIESLIGQLTDVSFLLAAVDAALALQAAAPDPARVQHEASLAKLQMGIKNLVGAMGDGEISREDFREKKAAVEVEIRALQLLLPPPPPKIDPQVVATLIAETFKQFAFLQFAEKRTLLQGAVRSIIVDGHARTLVGVTIDGGFLGSGANSALRSTAQLAISAIRDVVIRFPQPIEIPTIVAEDAAARRDTKKGQTAARQPQVRLDRLSRRRKRECKAGATAEQHAKKLAASAACKRRKRANLRETDPVAYAALKAKGAAEQKALRARRAAAKAALEKAA